MKLKSLFMLAVLTATTAGAQEVSWTWGRKLAPFTPKAVCTDFLNNPYTVSPYETGFTLADTTFSHYYYNKPATNGALFGFDASGRFVDATDLFTVENQDLDVASVVSDTRLNLYVAGHFRIRFFIDGTTINHGVVPYIQYPEVFLLKLDRDRHLAWSGRYSGFSSDACLGMGMSDEGNLVLVTQHNVLSDTTPVMLFNQDTLRIGNFSILFSEVDTLGHLLWARTCSFLENWSNQLQMTEGGDDNVYLTGFANGLIIGTDTVFNPLYTDFHPLPFIIGYGSRGELREASFLPWEIWSYDNDFKVTESGTRYYSCSVADTMVLAGDTVIIPPDSMGVMIIRADSANRPEWTRVLLYPYPSGSYFVPFRMAVLHDSVCYAIRAMGPFTFAGQTFDAGDSAQLFTGILNPEGALVLPFFSGPATEITPVNLLTDPCGNITLAGTLEGEMVFGADTIRSSMWDPVGFVANMTLVSPGTFDLGPDTSAYGPFTIHGPDGYVNYCWNRGLSWEQDLTVTQTGTYRLQVAGETHCWMEDSVYVVIKEQPGIMEQDKGSLRIYPNPADHSITILLDENSKSPLSFSMVNLYGKVILQGTGSGNRHRVDVAEYPPGLYFILVRSNELTASGKFIKL